MVNWITNLLKSDDVIHTLNAFQLMGVKINAENINVSSSIAIKDLNNNNVGELRSGVYSPNFKKVIGIAMINKPFWKVSQECQIIVDQNTYKASLCELPFI